MCLEFKLIFSDIYFEDSFGNKVPLRTIFGGQVHFLCDKFKCLILNTNGKVARVKNIVIIRISPFCSRRRDKNGILTALVSC